MFGFRGLLVIEVCLCGFVFGVFAIVCVGLIFFFVSFVVLL